ncbi:MAG: response regulator [Halobacteriales archaeon]|nr:response regulator [Halobacteriales archaeon]
MSLVDVTQPAVLHVDDDPALGDLVKTYLERETSEIDCTVTTETSPRDALATLRNDGQKFDCVISDYDMPGMNGIDFLDAVREIDPELPVLLFSGEETTDIAPKIIEAGLTDYLQKRPDTDTYTMLLRRVEHAVDAGGQFDAAEDTELSAVGVIGTDERIEQADEGYAALYGYDVEEIEGKHWAEIHPEREVKHIRNHVLPVVQEGGKWRGQSEGLRPDGSTFPLSKSVTALDDGRLLIAVSKLDAPEDASDD